MKGLAIANPNSHQALVYRRTFLAYTKERTVLKHLQLESAEEEKALPLKPEIRVL